MNELGDWKSLGGVPAHVTSIVRMVFYRDFPKTHPTQDADRIIEFKNK